MPNKKCATCWFWSEMIASAIGGGLMTAMCMNQDSDHYQEMTTIRQTCDAWEHGDGYSVDSPRMVEG